MLLKLNFIIFVLYNPVLCDITDLLNIGTVIFKTTDRFKNEWTQDELQLLEARKLLQKIIPSIDVIVPINDEYAKNVLKYLISAYSNIKIDSDDKIDDRLITIALSDVIGGYMKSWVLPAVKYGFYSGTVSYENANNLQLLYNIIKSYLNTNGDGWKCPNSNIINIIQMSTSASQKKYKTRSMGNPCEHLVLYEKTNYTYTIPIPVVNWGYRVATMFLPLRGLSIVSMTSPDSQDALLKYYDAATGCIKETKQEELSIFKEKFQKWLHFDVVPHLSDDELYTAFNNVVNILDDSRDLSHEVLNSTECYEKKSRKISPKIIFLIGLLLVELLWCFPAFIFVTWRKRRKYKGCGIKINKPFKYCRNRFKVNTCVRNESKKTSTVYNSVATNYKETDSVKYFCEDNSGNVTSLPVVTITEENERHKISKCYFWTNRKPNKDNNIITIKQPDNEFPCNAIVCKDVNNYDLIKLDGSSYEDQDKCNILDLPESTNYTNVSDTISSVTFKSIEKDQLFISIKEPQIKINVNSPKKHAKILLDIDSLTTEANRKQTQRKIDKVRNVCVNKTAMNYTVKIKRKLIKQNKVNKSSASIDGHKYFKRKKKKPVCNKLNITF